MKNQDNIASTADWKEEKPKMVPPTPIKKGGGTRSVFDQNDFGSPLPHSPEARTRYVLSDDMRSPPTKKMDSRTRMMPPPTPVRRTKRDFSSISAGAVGKVLFSPVKGNSSVESIDETFFKKPEPVAAKLPIKQQLISALKADDVNALKKLVARGINLEENLDSGQTPLLYSSFNAKWNVFKYLVSLPQVNVDAKDHFNSTAMHNVAMNDVAEGRMNYCISCVEDAVKLMNGARYTLANVPYGEAVANLEAEEVRRATALECIGLLMSRGANPLVQAANSQTALFKANDYAGVEMYNAIYDYQVDYICNLAEKNREKAEKLLDIRNGQFNKEKEGFIR